MRTTSREAVRLKRAYEPAEPDDGFRVLVDRLWPRGVSKGALAVDAWFRELGPSDELRRWFGHDPARWKEFASRYREELRREPCDELVASLVARAERGPITLVYAAKDELHNQAIVLRGVIARRARRPARPRPRPSMGGKARDRARATGRAVTSAK
jgi:uncharacterized protein YeaO (DUF488 family)